MTAREFVVLNRNGTEVDSVDPYESHEVIGPNLVRVRHAIHEYEVEIPEGGSFEVREMEEPNDSA